MKKNVVAIVVVAVIALAGFGTWYFTSSSITYLGTPESITIGNPSSNAVPALIYIADDQGFFARNDLNVTIKNYITSFDVINDLKDDKIDISVTTEYTVLTEVFKKENISIISIIGKYQEAFLVGRKNRGIENVSDLKGKKIGLTRGVQGEFYLGRFLNLHGMSIQDVNLVDIKPSQYVDAIANGSVDAILTNIFYLDPVEERLGNNQVTWPAQSSQPGYWVISSRNDWITSHPESINRLLKSLDQAEEYIIEHPDSAKAIVKKRMNYTDAYMATIWPNYQLSLTLDQSLLIAMNDEGRWMIDNNLTSEKTLPYFRDYIYTKGMEKVKPEAVNIR
ncbi:NMT1/THI5 like protein [uncultured archaeon]|nr:NMT1/THI5 like protein [uncultured archaeon]